VRGLEFNAEVQVEVKEGLISARVLTELEFCIDFASRNTNTNAKQSQPSTCASALNSTPCTLACLANVHLSQPH
jgi:hypothetical protein